ncbi:heterokaryon incompatibility protein-domain-containing protein [Cercophora newfieldiana]|uniref:Heterokaryon incompatibility protein-domain-containing protein n=1 Tax=Cercophora newfieldiana TaxID=92897 RepID=A0AA39YBN8_9PEZI|nr:heterokaryon incompatibility protein-domain-containing protein [Cercophora newfieldiana]
MYELVKGFDLSLGLSNIDSIDIGLLDNFEYLDGCAGCQRHLEHLDSPHRLSPSERKRADLGVELWMPAESTGSQEYRDRLVELAGGSQPACTIYLKLKSGILKPGPSWLVDESGIGGVRRWLGSRHVPDMVDYDMVRGWVNHCRNSHGNICNPDQAPELRDINLIDVIDEVLVPFPHDESSVDYLCLSYVWGSRSQHITITENKLERVPKTVRDAMDIAKGLGKRYLWVDSICIRQSDSAHKQGQIALMHLIYRSAWATIVALDADSAESGISRVQNRTGTGSLDCREEESFCVNGVIFRPIRGSLQQAIDESPWNKRAWTYQEAVLSPRCLYFSEDEVHFECGLVQFCESRCEMSSPPHRANLGQLMDLMRLRGLNDNGPYAHLDPMVFSAVERLIAAPAVDPLDRWPNWTRRKFYTYADTTRDYWNRELTYQSDALAAFTGILNRFSEEMYPGGFSWGLPIEALADALLWEEWSDARHREDFPSWSWLRWAGNKDWRLMVELERPSDLDHHLVPISFWLPRNGSLVVANNTPGMVYPLQDIPSERELGATPPPLEHYQLSQNVLEKLLVVRGWVVPLEVGSMTKGRSYWADATLHISGHDALQCESQYLKKYLSQDQGQGSQSVMWLLQLCCKEAATFGVRSLGVMRPELTFMILGGWDARPVTPVGEATAFPPIATRLGLLRFQIPPNEEFRQLFQNAREEFVFLV